MPYIASLCRSSRSRHQPVSARQQSPSALAAANSTLPASLARNGRVVHLDYATWHAILSAKYRRPADLVSHSMKEPAPKEQDAIAA
jgi:hypothetical protein